MRNVGLLGVFLDSISRRDRTGFVNRDEPMNDSTAWQVNCLSHRARFWAAWLMVGLFMSAYSCKATDPDEEGQRESAITGTIRTSGGSPQHGILVSATGEGQKHTTSVFSDDQGVYAPPLPLGSYRVFVGTPMIPTESI